MTLRYFSYLALALVAGFIVVVTQAFSGATVEWLTLAAGILFALTGAAMLPRPGVVHRALNTAIMVLGGLMIIETLLTAGSISLSFAGALAVLSAAIVGLTAHELSTERVVHSLEVAPSGTREKAGVTA
jgi:hypothetical protein